MGNQLGRIIERHKHWVAPIIGGLLILLAVLAYAPAMTGGPVFDDDLLIFQNPNLLSLEGLGKIWASAHQPDYFPVTYTLWWAEHHLWGNEFFWYHLINVLLHAGGAFILWRIMLRLRLPGGLLAAFLFALHPVNAASVAWLSEQKNTLCLTMSLVALLLYLEHEKTGRWGWYVAATACFVLGLLAKPALIALPLIVLVLAWAQRGRITKLDCLRMVPWGILSVAIGVVTIVFQQRAMLEPDTTLLAGRVARAGAALWFYLYNALLPVNLMGVYPRWGPMGGGIVEYLPDALFAAVLIGLWATRSRIGRWPMAAALCIGLVLGPVLGVVRMSYSEFSFVSDHLAYAGMPILMACMAAAIHVLCGRSKHAGVMTRVVGCAVVAGMMLLTFLRTPQYASDLAFWTAAARADPENKNVEYCYGDSLREDAEAQKNPQVAAMESDQAIAALEKATELGSGEAENNLGTLLYSRGRVDEALKHLRAAIAFDERILAAAPDEILTRRMTEELAGEQFSMGLILASAGRDPEAAAHLREAIKYQPKVREEHSLLAEVLLKLGDRQGALDEVRRALEIDPNWGYAQHLLGTIEATTRPGG